MPKGGARPGAGRKKGIKKPYVTFSIAVPEEVSEQIKQKAKEAGLSVSKFLVTKALK